MKIFIAIILMALAFYLLYLVTQKKRSKQASFTALSKSVYKVRSFSSVLLLISIFLLCKEYGIGIGWVSFFVLISPVLFLLILFVNNLQKKTTKQS